MIRNPRVCNVSMATFQAPRRSGATRNNAAAMFISSLFDAARVDGFDQSSFDPTIWQNSSVHLPKPPLERSTARPTPSLTRPSSRSSRSFSEQRPQHQESTWDKGVQQHCHPSPIDRASWVLGHLERMGFTVNPSTLPGSLYPPPIHPPLTTSHHVRTYCIHRSNSIPTRHVHFDSRTHRHSFPLQSATNIHI